MPQKEQLALTQTLVNACNSRPGISEEPTA